MMLTFTNASASAVPRCRRLFALTRRRRDSPLECVRQRRRFNHAARKPPLKASPAPVMSTMSPHGSRRQLSSRTDGPAALAPSLITTMHFLRARIGSAAFKSAASAYNAASFSFTNTRFSAGFDQRRQPGIARQFVVPAEIPQRRHAAFGELRDLPRPRCGVTRKQR